MKTRDLKFDNYTIKVRPIKTDSNYNISASLYNDNELIFGTVLKEKSTDKQIIWFFKKAIENEKKKRNFADLKLF